MSTLGVLFLFVAKKGNWIVWPKSDSFIQTQIEFMNRYIQISIDTRDSEESDIFVARLSQAGFEGFEEEPGKLHAFIPESFYDPQLAENIIRTVKGVADPYHAFFKIQWIEPRNWNEAWEKEFEPVRIEDFCAIRAEFHPPTSGVLYDLIITPKMSFGTGHHATTYMMVAAMQKFDFRNKSVLDFGTGTGLLAILACKMGAASELALDCDDWSIENAMENTRLNGCSDIEIEKAETLVGKGRFDFILANLNLRVILENMKNFQQHLTQTGVLIGSGVLESDEEKIRISAASNGFTMKRLMTRESWICFLLKTQATSEIIGD